MLILIAFHSQVNLGPQVHRVLGVITDSRGFQVSKEIQVQSEIKEIWVFKVPKEMQVRAFAELL